MEERVILVDEQDREIGTAEKMQVHLDGSLHRAFSIFVFNPEAGLLLQRRAGGKYHSPGLWSNSCCGHPRPGESTASAAKRRLREELGFDCELHHCFSFVYREAVGNGLVEHEYDHVFAGWSAQPPLPNPDEVGDWGWLPLEQVRQEVRTESAKFTRWFPPALEALTTHLQDPGGRRVPVPDLALTYAPSDGYSLEAQQILTFKK